MRKNYSAEEKQAIIDKYSSGVVVTEIAKSTALQETRFIVGLKKMKDTRRNPKK